MLEIIGRVVVEEKHWEIACFHWRKAKICKRELCKQQTTITTILVSPTRVHRLQCQRQRGRELRQGEPPVLAWSTMVAHDSG